MEKRYKKSAATFIKKMASKPCTRALVYLLLLILAPNAHAIDTEPFPSFSQSPLVQVYGLPMLGSARVVDPGQWRGAIVYTVANHFTGDARAGEALFFDGESQRMTFVLRHGAGHGFEWGIELPHVSYTSGYLDNFIERWHDTFGLPQHGRSDLPRNRLLLLYQRNGMTLLNMSRAGAGIGDLRLTAATQLRRGGPDLALRAALKLPTGDEAQLHGSGATDFALWLSVDCGSHCRGAWSYYYGGGILALGRGEVIADLQRRVVAFGTLGLAWRAAARLELKVQLDGHDAFYRDSELRQLASPSVQIGLGLSWQLESQWALDFAMTEDLIVDTAPDLTVYAALRTRF